MTINFSIRIVDNDGNPVSRATVTVSENVILGHLDGSKNTDSDG